MDAMTFFETLAHAEKRNNSHLRIGLDPRLAQIPEHIRDNENALFDFCVAIIDATKDLASAYKPQIAYFAAEDQCDVLKSLILYIHDTTERSLSFSMQNAETSRQQPNVTPSRPSRYTKQTP